MKRAHPRRKFSRVSWGCLAWSLHCYETLGKPFPSSRPQIDDLDILNMQPPGPSQVAVDASVCRCSLCLCQEGLGPTLPWQEWREELKNLTKLLHRTEELGREEADAWNRDEAVEEATWKLQMIYGNGAESKNYEELLRAKPKRKIPTSRVITLKAEEVASSSFFSRFHPGSDV